jgi:hypothetical protein
VGLGSGKTLPGVLVPAVEVKAVMVISPSVPSVAANPRVVGLAVLPVMLIKMMKTRLPMLPSVPSVLWGCLVLFPLMSRLSEAIHRMKIAYLLAN